MIDGGTGSDIASLDDGGDLAGNTGVLTSTLVTGLSTGNIQYTGLEDLNIWLGKGNNTFNARSTYSDGVTITDTLVTSRGGNDIFNIGSTGNDLVDIDSRLELVAGGGTDRINFNNGGDADGDEAGAGARRLDGHAVLEDRVAALAHLRDQAEHRDETDNHRRSVSLGQLYEPTERWSKPAGINVEGP